MHKLTTAQKKVMRRMADSDESVKIAPRTAAPLKRAGYVNEVEPGRFRLNRVGTLAVERWVRETGDGPEDLKAMFSFLSPR